MTLGTKLECDHFKGETLEVNKVYNERLFLVKHSNGATIAAEDMHDGPRLCLAHVPKDKCKLRIKQEQIKDHQW